MWAALKGDIATPAQERVDVDVQRLRPESDLEGLNKLDADDVMLVFRRNKMTMT